MTSADWRSQAGVLAKDVMDRFLVPHDPSGFQLKFKQARASLPAVFTPLADTFEKNVSAILATVCIPVTLAVAAAEGSHWQRIHAAERIRSLNLKAQAGEEEAALEARRDDSALKVASEKMREFATSSDGRDKMAADACRFLLNSLRSSDLSAAAAELVLQGCVLIWSAFETFARDLFEAILNADPNRALAVIQDPAAKQRLRSRFSVAELASYGFDLSSSLGSALASEQDFSDIRTIKAAILPALNSDQAVAAALAEKRLWVLCQQRHLIVHRRGVVDAHYLEATGEQCPIGSRLSVAPCELEAQIDAVVTAGCQLLIAVRSHAS